MTTLWTILAQAGTHTRQEVVGTDASRISCIAPEDRITENLVLNPNFAETTDGWRTRVDAGAPIHGVKPGMATITALSPEDRGRWLYQFVTVSPGKVYNLTGEISGQTSHTGASVNVTLWDDLSEYIMGYHAQPEHASTSPDPVKVIATGLTIPDGVSKARVELRLWDAATGTVGFTKIRFGPADPLSIMDTADMAQLIQFNPLAALQGRIFADGFVPNSQEVESLQGTQTYIVQRAENLDTGEVRAYFVLHGDWEDVRFITR